ncbi:hypothetical protein PsexTeo8_04610 [Pseudomonas extremaustralis]|uniref:DUF3800 domain-containing protein n=1 Tax=Pseudomonas extremaustralis TaxID=359110 RepID=UPI002AA0DFCC|nr:DUF3800 domain-containing protein [Pseudomonas extremaustralis]MDY7064058.1 hypothetical protein [Pseudomonas extremaustralis]
MADEKLTSPQFLLFESESEAERDAEVVAAKPPTGAFSNFIVYVDESGDHGMQTLDVNYPMFVLAFCVFHKRHYCEKVIPALQKFKFNHMGHDLVGLHELGEQQGPIHNPYHLALGFCLETLYEFLQEKNQQGALTHVIFERRGRKEDNELELEFRRMCDGANRLGIRLPFEIVFATKQVNSTGLQLADLVARPIGMSVLRPGQENRAFDVLTRKFYCSGGRSKVGEGFENWGLKIFPVAESEKPR